MQNEENTKIIGLVPFLQWKKTREIASGILSVLSA